MCADNRRNLAERGRRGAAAVEAAAVLSLVTLLIFGIIEFGRVMMVHQVMVNASREAARTAILPRRTQASVQSVVSSYMTSANIGGYTQQLHVNGSVALLSTATSGDTISVRVTVPYSQVSWSVLGLIPDSRQLAAEVDMRKE